MPIYQLRIPGKDKEYTNSKMKIIAALQNKHDAEARFPMCVQTKEAVK